MIRPPVAAFCLPESSPCWDESLAVATPDAPNLCPGSQTIGLKVDLVTVKALVNAEALRRLDGKVYRFCPATDCDIVYFDDRLTDEIHARQPYAAKGQRNQRNSADRIFLRGGSRLLLDPVRNGQGYAAAFPIALQLS